MGLASILSISLQGTLSLMTALGGRTGGGTRASAPGAKGDSWSQSTEMWSLQEKHIRVTFIWIGLSWQVGWRPMESFFLQGQQTSASLTSGCGARLCSAVDFPSTEAHTDLTGLMVWDPGLQELRGRES